MKTLSALSILIAILIINSNSLFGQLYAAQGGYLLVFQEQPDKNAKVTVENDKGKNVDYQWPSGPNDFILSYREALQQFPTSFSLSDVDLRKIWDKLSTTNDFAYAYQYHPALLFALGQAAYLPHQESISQYPITLKGEGQSKTTKVLDLVDPRKLPPPTVSIEPSDYGVSIQLRLIFPKNAWIDSARVYKKILGAKDSIQIFPFVFTSILSDRIEMNIRDTSKTVGEYIYSIQPHDQLGLWHTTLKGIYAQNYNGLSAPSIVNFRTHSIADTKSIHLSWRSTVPERVRGFEVYRSPQQEGPFMKVASLPATDSTYTDHVAGVMQNFFYYVQVLDQTGEGMKSITHFVTSLFKEKPMAPIDPLAESVPGGVKISWPSWDAMHHVRGYYVYRSDGDTSAWTQISAFIPQRDSMMFFVDTSAVLRAEKEYAYVVKSESTSYLLSSNSKPAWGRPDISRSVASPQQVDWRYLDDGRLMLYWDDMKSKDPMIMNYYVAETDGDVNSLRMIPGAKVEAIHNSWIFTETSTTTSQYCIIAEDAWGNKSRCSVQVLPLRHSIFSNPGDILVHPNSKGYQLIWGLPEDKNVKTIQLYEASETGNPSLVKSLTPTAATFNLPLLKAGESKIFYLTYQYEDGQESAPGKAVVIRN